MKNEKMKWYFLIAVALVVGAIIGYFATANLATTGNARNAINAQKPIQVNPAVKVGLDCVCGGIDTMCFGYGPDGDVDCDACCKDVIRPITPNEK